MSSRPEPASVTAPLTVEAPGNPNAAPSYTQLLDLLACPACHHPLRETSQETSQNAGRHAAGELTCTGCARAYPVIDGIPILLVDRATEHPAR